MSCSAICVTKMLPIMRFTNSRSVGSYSRTSQDCTISISPCSGAGSAGPCLPLGDPFVSGTYVSASTNPFHFGPATGEEFVGRWPLVQEMENELRNGHGSFGCIGGRRFGKTSILSVL